MRDHDQSMTDFRQMTPQTSSGFLR